MKKPLIDHHELLRVVYYDPLTGIFYRKVAARGQAIGNVMGHLSDGYLTAMVSGRKYKLHVLAWFYMTGEWPSHEVDHRNTIRTDNTFNNLRMATKLQNCWNKRKKPDATSRFKGVTPVRNSSRFKARITVNGILEYLGVFPTEELAHEAYCRRARDAFGDFFRDK